MQQTTSLARVNRASSIVLRGKHISRPVYTAVLFDNRAQCVHAVKSFIRGKNPRDFLAPCMGCCVSRCHGRLKIHVSEGARFSHLVTIFFIFFNDRRLHYIQKIFIHLLSSSSRRPSAHQRTQSLSILSAIRGLHLPLSI